MTLAPGTKLGGYEVLAPLGAGGMGEVFRARDTKLSRDVAIKVLPAAFAEDEDRVARFRREAQLVASLNHPNVAAIHGLEEANGTLALVMELVEGEDLSQRLSRGALPMDEAVALGKQIAEGLEAAHEKGIVHRDLKPANVKLTADGAVKILDFGLGKVLEGAAVNVDGGLTNSPTMSRHMTEAGLILGTAAYMSPEQARGKPADKRADIWALGVVLYEMLTGTRLFEGETVSDTLAGVLKGEIDLGALPPSTPGELERLLRRCLERNPKNRLHDVADARLVLAEIEAGVGEEASAAPAGAGSRPRSRARELAPWGLALVATAVALALLAARASQEPPRPRVIRASLALPAGVSIELDGERAGMPALSPDGRRIACGAREGTGPLRIWVVVLATGASRALPGTEGGYRPFWSPNGERIGFFTWRDLATTPADGGPVTRLASARDARGGTWSPSGTILYSPYFTGPLYAISERGGEPRAVTGSPEKIGSGTHRFPQFLPGGERFLYLDRPTSFGAGGVFVGSLKGSPPRRILEKASNAVFSEGYLLTVRDDALVAQRFDPERLVLSGEARILAGDLLVNRRFAFGNFSAGAGLAAFLTGRQRDLSRLVWRERTGKKLGELGTPGNLSGSGGLSLSRDGRWAAVSRVDTGQGDSDVWLYDLSRGAETRLARPGTDELDPIFTPDGGALVFASTEDRDVARLLRRDLASGQETTILTTKGSVTKGPMAITPDGTGIVCDGRDVRQVSDVVLIGMDGRGEVPVLPRTPADESRGQISPDGRWLAWEADDSGRYEVYVAPFPAGGSRVQVSREGGNQPRWNPRGGELFFRAPDNMLAAVAVDTASGTISFGAPARLFPVVDFWGWTYAVAPDGARFLVREPEVEAEASHITLLTDWTSLLSVPR